MQRRCRLFQRRIAVCLLAGMFAAAGISMLMIEPIPSAYAGMRPSDASAAVTRSVLSGSGAASRGGFLEGVDAGGGSWGMPDSDGEIGRLTVIGADNPVVRSLVNGRDEGWTPDGFDPNHVTGDVGNAYAFSQCTWWAYVRRHQLGLPVGSHMGNGADWADTARGLGYWVDDVPRVGDVVCFQRGQYGADPTYGHVGIVETVGQDGSFTTSECGAIYNGKPFSRTFTAEQAKQLQFIHY